MRSRSGIEREARRIIAADYAGRPITDDAIDWATKALEAGFDSANVCMLAASSKPANWFETEPYFRRALGEVGIPWPDRDDALWNVALDTAEAIVEGKVDPQKGVGMLTRIAIDLDYPEALMELYCLDDELEIRYGPNRVTPEDWRVAARSAAERFLNSTLSRGT